MKVDEFTKILRNGHLYTSLFHFTDTENLTSITQHGILSKRQARDQNVVIRRFGGNEWSHDADAHKGLEDYVNLCFTQNHPMCHLANLEGRIPNPRYIPVSAEVLRIPDVKITIGVANKSGVELLSVEDGLERLDKEVLYTRTDWNDLNIQTRLRLAEKCEVLVPKLVPVKFLSL